MQLIVILFLLLYFIIFNLILLVLELNPLHILIKTSYLLQLDSCNEHLSKFPSNTSSWFYFFRLSTSSALNLSVSDIFSIFSLFQLLFTKVHQLYYSSCFPYYFWLNQNVKNHCYLESEQHSLMSFMDFIQMCLINSNEVTANLAIYQIEIFDSSLYFNFVFYSYWAWTFTISYFVFNYIASLFNY